LKYVDNELQQWNIENIAKVEIVWDSNPDNKFLPPIKYNAQDSKYGVS
jgi:hypothetical protein